MLADVKTTSQTHVLKAAEDSPAAVNEAAARSTIDPDLAARTVRAINAEALASVKRLLAGRTRRSDPNGRAIQVVLDDTRVGLSPTERMLLWTEIG